MSSQNSALTQSTRPHKKGSLPDIPWTANNNKLILLLLGEMEKRENAKVLFAEEKGKVSPLIFKIKNVNTIFIFLELLQRQEEHHP